MYILAHCLAQEKLQINFTLITYVTNWEFTGEEFICRCVTWQSYRLKKLIGARYLRKCPAFIKNWGTSLVVQWLRICLPMKGTWVWALVQEDPTCRGATKPVHHDYWACALEPASHNYWAHAPRLLKSARLEPTSHNNWAHVLQLLKFNYWTTATREATAMRSPCTATKSSPRSLQLEKAHAQQQTPNAAKNKSMNK